MLSPTGHSQYIDPAFLFGVEGQVAVVTGGGTGIGLMIATALENNGATVYIIGRRLQVLEQAARDNNRFGKLIPLQGDITSRESLLNIVDAVRRRHGYIDILVNNAGIARNLLPAKLPSPLDNIDAVGRATAPPSILAYQQVLWDTSDPMGFTESFETNVSAVYQTTVAFLDLLYQGNLRKGILPPKYAAARATATTPCPPPHTNGAVSADNSGRSTPYHSLPPTPPQCTPPPEPSRELPDAREGPNGADASSSAHNGTAANGHAASAPRMHIPEPASHVITISSSGAFRIDARMLSVSYTLAKVAVTHLGRLLANLLSDWGIRSNVLAPGVFPSEMTTLQHLTPAGLAQAVPVGRAGGLTDMAGPILFLAGRAGAYVNGAVWLVDGGRVGSLPNSYQW
ncbi:NAD(P)-binding protein [Coniophora puteana RWD-64-598 SS2]|uniref:NAD(P)-binding protein n=1 Tax=Coniophora puteana (strain RWD-64-598) TaxID=741705 RepID=A0A5M3MPP3_CONPW|nr:NAD(P)-binding protein [Coniophora puteana RWD-64-598 SS2]EIW81093.1 NAD(P)-binding protein [Coniophora puteana RWD-64-598 SS2]